MIFWLTIAAVWLISTISLGWLAFDYFSMAWYWSVLVTIIPTLIVVGFLFLASRFLVVQ